MRIPNIDRLDDPGHSPQAPAEESLDAFTREALEPSSESLHVSPSEKLTVVEMEESPDDGNPLDVFAAEQNRFRFEPLELARPETPERFERVERLERLERFERFERLGGLVALGAVAIITIGALNWFRDVDAKPPEAPARARVESQPAAPVPRVIGVNDSTAKAMDRLVAVPKPVVVPAKQRVVAPGKKPAVVPSTSAPERVVKSTSQPPAQLPTPTTGLALAEVRVGPSASTPIVSTFGTTAAAPTASAAAPPAPAPTPVAAPPVSPPPSAATAPTRVAASRAAVESVLGRYASAFSSLDAQSAKAVWPSVNQRNLERAFESLEQQDFDLGECDITVLPPRALALCDGTARYTPKVGNRKERSETRRWTFRLTQNGPDWSIESVESR